MKTLKWLVPALIVAITLGLTAPTLWAQGVISLSKHDLSTATGNTDEVCVFCHTPHGAANAVGAPLWNKVLETDDTNFTRYASTTLDGVNSTVVGGTSLACLSCHDGTQARDVVINAPGSGGYNSAGTQIDSGVFGTMTANFGTPVPSLTQDLTDDHPISIPYGGGGGPAGAVKPAGSTNDPSFNQAEYSAINGGFWWVDTAAGTGGQRDKTDMILYTRAGAPSVECGSCHDPHNGGGNVSFMRVQNTGSQVCLACHIK